MVNKIRFFYFFVFTLLFSFSSCKSDTTEPPQPNRRTVLVYMAADNSLSSFVANNFSDMITGMNSDQTNLLVYVDASGNGGGKLWQITPQGERLVSEYAEANSATATELSRVISDVRTGYPAASYGLILWSHGGGWWPAEDLYFRGRPTSALDHREMFDSRRLMNGPMTKYFGVDGTHGMDISELALALPQDRSFDFLIFDACFMSSVEALYDLRHAAKWIIASPAEVMGVGFPYNTIVPLLVADNFQPSKVVDAFMAFYRSYTIGGESYNSAALTVIDTEKLEALAQAARQIVAANPMLTVASNLVQPYETHNPHLFFDLEHLMELRAAGSPQLYAAFQSVLAAAVPHASHTNSIWSVYNGWFAVNRSCGVNTYIPGSNTPFIDAAYAQTAWSKAVYGQN